MHNVTSIEIIKIPKKRQNIENIWLMVNLFHGWESPEFDSTGFLVWWYFIFKDSHLHVLVLRQSYICCKIS